MWHSYNSQDYRNDLGKEKDMLSSTSRKYKVTVKLHYPHTSISEYTDVTRIDLVGKHSDVLRITMKGHTVRYPLKNVLRYETIELGSGERKCGNS
jgi:hypothetical protein